jgi:peptidoglycan/xylan/chitin deacetylase (PgdA/CDA1 family)
VAEWNDLDAELALWDRPVSFWWRDDDAVAASHQLDRLIALTIEYEVPLQLAVIPAKLDAMLIDRLEGERLVWVCQHGFDHHNNALPGQRKIELGGRLERNDLLEKLQSGRKRLQIAFAGQYLDVLVPPWNRIEKKLLSSLPRMGYQRLSILGPRQHQETELAQLNVHVDIIDWKARAFVGESVALERIIDHLRDRRTRQVDDSEPTGIMTHHLVQDELCWEFLRDFFTYARTQAGLFWLGGHQLLTS